MNDYNIQIKSAVDTFKNIAFKNKLLLSDFLNATKINYNGNEYTINQIIENEIVSHENQLDNKYVYWCEGGSSWRKWNTGDVILKPEEEISMISSSYDLHYIYIDDFESVKNKVKNIYGFLLKLQALLLSLNINTKIETNGFTSTLDPVANEYKFNIEYVSNFFKDPSFNLKLVFDTSPVSGGMRKPKKHHNHKVNRKYLGSLIKTIYTSNITKLTDVDKAQLIETGYRVLNKKPIVSFDVKYFHVLKKTTPDLIRKSTLNIPLFKDKYVQSTPGKINTLTNLGLLTFSYLTTTNRNDEMGLNVDKYRQDAFIKSEFKENKQNVVIFFTKLLETYKAIYKDRKEYNIFFVDKIESVIKDNSVNAYNEFIDFVERWVISKFRPYINSFIKEFNNDLTPYGIKLFIAGGDAMRRYKDDITVTKDIDTKLYITGAEINAGLSKEDFKKHIVSLILKHTVKLRNYMQENLSSILSEHSMVKEFIHYKASNYNFNFNLILDDKANDQIRSREILKNDSFPVDLYSIDYRAKLVITSTDPAKPIEITKNFDISLLDVVLQDNIDDIFDPSYCIDFDGIPVASLDFLLKDFKTTYTIDDRALGRIYTSKYLKDITRHKQLLEIYENAINKSKELGIPIDNSFFTIADDDIVLNSSLDDYKSILQNLISQHLFDLNYGKLLLTIFKLYVQNNEKIYMFDLIIIKSILKYVDRCLIQFASDEYGDQNTIDNFNKIKEILLFLKLKTTENLNNHSDDIYIPYDYENSDDEIVKYYLHIFTAILNQNDGLQKHYMPYYRNKVKSFLNSLVPAGIYVKTTKSANPKASRGAPKKAPASNSRIATAKVVKVAKAAKKQDLSSSSSDAPIPVLSVTTTRGRQSVKPSVYVP